MSHEGDRKRKDDLAREADARDRKLAFRILWPRLGATLNANGAELALLRVVDIFDIESGDGFHLVVACGRGERKRGRHSF